MNSDRSILLDPRFETQPVIQTGDYEFAWNPFGHVVITNRKGDVKPYSLDALKRLTNSTGMPVAVRCMAAEALDWADKNKRR